MLGNSVGVTTEKLYVPLGGFCGTIGGYRALMAGPSLLHLIYLNIQEACFPGHLPENWGEVIRPFLFKHGSVGLVVGPPGCFYHLRLLGEGLLSGFPDCSSQVSASCEGFLGWVTGILLFLPQIGHALVGWRMPLLDTGSRHWYVWCEGQWDRPHVSNGLWPSWDWHLYGGA